MNAKGETVCDVVVVGAGHAGCEAAHSAARLGARVFCVAMNADLIAQMSCNPAVGGIAKGHLVREIDALGGLQGLVADETGIQFRLLNRSRGPAVQGPRTQSDKDAYRVSMKRHLEQTPGLSILQGEAVSVLTQKNRASGVQLDDGRFLSSRSVVIASGTFLNGMIHIGAKSTPAGRAGESPSNFLSHSLKNLGFTSSRLKTGTPPRVDLRTIDTSALTAHEADAHPVFFSFLSTASCLPQITCFITHTDERIHSLVRGSLHLSALYGGQISGVGPRYCPSLEDKVVKFPQRDAHQIFLEPEGLGTSSVYLNGMSSSMPVDIQAEILSMLPGCSNAVMLRPGYAIEYDYFHPTQLLPTLETRLVRGLFFAGQINGTSGYEEAAAQGLLAGINAACSALNRAPVVVPRSQGYLGVLVDDLVHRGVDEPYRLFTSRSEFRLMFRIDNADERFTPLGIEIGLVDDRRKRVFKDKYSHVFAISSHVRNTTVAENHPRWGVLPQTIREMAGAGKRAEKLLKMPEVSIESIAALWPDISTCDISLLKQVEYDVKYSGYISMAQQERLKYENRRHRLIPHEALFEEIPSLTQEIRERLLRFKPSTMADAERIPGMTPAAIDAISVHLDLRGKRERDAPNKGTNEGLCTENKALGATVSRETTTGDTPEGE